MIARVAFDYSAQKLMSEIAEADDLVYGTLRSIFGDAAPDAEHKATYYHWPSETLIDTDTDGPALSALGIIFIVKGYKGTLPLQALLPSGQSYTVYVQVPHVGLLAMDEVMVEENCCSDLLQRRLDEGWRILCVCPPNAARRPDYILGRTKDT